MCGICGILGVENKELVKKMCSIIQHRGPDDGGLFSDKNVTLGHRRLSIIDLSRKGRQPMSNENGTLQIVFNGEIYNFIDLKEELGKKGHKFNSNTDTEVIIHAYEEYGERCLSRFNGMFAFAIWDSRKKSLFLARDRAGIKPLYYKIQGDKLIFASEIKAILLDKDTKRELNLEAFHNYLW